MGIALLAAFCNAVWEAVDLYVVVDWDFGKFLINSIEPLLMCQIGDNDVGVSRSTPTVRQALTDKAHI